MNCPEHLVLQALDGRIWIWMYYRDVPRKSIPLRVWLNPLRYQITVDFGKRITINPEGLWNNAIGNFLFAHVRPKLCKWFGIHQRFKFVGGEKLCSHCKVGREDFDC